jgi:hypothetical protein
MMDERVEQLNAVRSVSTHSKLVILVAQKWIFLVVFFNRRFPLFTPPILSNLIENFYLIIGCF